jgi:aquaporin Z
MSALVAEVILMAFFLIVILGSTKVGAPKVFAPIAIGLALTLIHLISISISISISIIIITKTSVNSPRFLNQALFGYGVYLSKVWLFWVAPIVGAIIGEIIHKTLFKEE